MDSIGGYLGLELPARHGWSSPGIPVDLGRHALEIILRTRGYRRLLVPRYTCSVLAPSIRRSGVEVTFYDLNELLEPVFPVGHPKPEEAVLYTNYYGLKQDMATRLAKTVPNLILDYAQDFYGSIPPGIDAFTTCRKFMGVPDGAYLFCAAAHDMELKPAHAEGRYKHLLVAADQGIEAGFPLSQAHERALDDAPARGMSHLTNLLVAGTDHAKIMAVRRQNRDHLHRALGPLNKLPINPATATVPMVYPLMWDHAQKLRNRLLEAKIYTARYWPDLLAPLSPSDGGNLFLDQVVYLPVDQRYGTPDMDRILHVILD